MNYFRLTLNQIKKTIAERVSTHRIREKAFLLQEKVIEPQQVKEINEGTWLVDIGDVLPCDVIGRNGLK